MTEQPIRDLTPIRPLNDPHTAVQPLLGPVELASERERGPVVYIPGAHGGFVAVCREDLPTVPAAPAPVPAPTGVDPQAQRTAARGVLAAGTGVGAYFAAGALAIALDSLVQVLIAAGVAAGVAVAGAGQRGGGNTFITHHHVSNRWWGRSHTSIRNH